MDPREREKQLAAAHAAGLVEHHMTVGLGTGSTVEHVIRALGARVRSGLAMCAVATSAASAELAQQENIELADLDEVPRLDLTLDGADEVDPQLRLIKGAGGALLHEKIVALASERLIIVVDGGKLVETLGRGPVPIEVVPFGWERVAHELARLGGQPQLRKLDQATPFVTEGGHYILDCPFGLIERPYALADTLDRTVGIVEHGLFLDMAELVIVGEGEGTRCLCPSGAGDKDPPRL